MDAGPLNTSGASGGAREGGDVVLDHDAIARRIPHAGTMALLHSLRQWDDERITCHATGHTDPQHPLRTTSGLLAPAAIEYAAQAMALHGALIAEHRNPNAEVQPGFLASVRGVTLHVARLDNLPSPLVIEATRSATSGVNILYEFRVSSASGLAAEGRATVVLNTPIAGAQAAASNPGATSNAS
jgi:predicted hotdog family 3-hydroxylacyl-ACP dehydratase